MHNFSLASYLWYVSDSISLLRFLYFNVLFGKRLTLLSAELTLLIVMVQIFSFVRAPRMNSKVTNFFIKYLNSISLFPGRLAY